MVIVVFYNNYHKNLQRSLESFDICRKFLFRKEYSVQWILTELSSHGEIRSCKRCQIVADFKSWKNRLSDMSKITFRDHIKTVENVTETEFHLVCLVAFTLCLIAEKKSYSNREDTSLNKISLKEVFKNTLKSFGYCGCFILNEHDLLHRVSSTENRSICCLCGSLKSITTGYCS